MKLLSLWNVFAVAALLYFKLTGTLAKENDQRKFSKLFVWLDHTVRYAEDELDNSYSEKDLMAMVKVVLSRFSNIVLEPAPTLEKLPENSLEKFPSGLRLPSIVAKWNKEHKQNVHIIPSFDMTEGNIKERLGITPPQKPVTSFKTALYMANLANEIYAGTVDTLLMTNFVGIKTLQAHNQDIRDISKELKLLKNLTGGNSYDLAVMIDFPSCGIFGGEVTQLVKEILEFVDIIVVHIGKQVKTPFHWPSDPEVGHVMFQKYFEECHRKLKMERENISVIPFFACGSGPPGKSCEKNSKPDFSFRRCWELLDQWGKENNKEVIVYEAFDIPRKSDPVVLKRRNEYCMSGWWQMVKEAIGEQNITESMFIEKIPDSRYPEFPEGKVTVSTTPHNVVETPPSSKVEGETTTLSSNGNVPIETSTEGGSGSSPSSEEASPQDNTEGLLDTIYLTISILLVSCTFLAVGTAGLGIYGVMLKFNKVRGRTADSYIDSRYAAPSKDK